MDNTEREGFIAHSTLPSFKRKVEMTKETIKEALAIAPAYVAVSWGKDSTVLLHLCQQVKPDILAVCWEDVDMDIQSNYAEVKSTYFDKNRTNYLPIIFNPDEYNESALNPVLDEYPIGIIGCRAEESKNRRISIKKYGLIHQYKSPKKKGKYRVYPLAFWTYLDIWCYIVINGLPYLNTYRNNLTARTAIIHNFNVHRDPHMRFVLSDVLNRLRIESPEYYKKYLEKYPEIAQMF